MRLFLLCSSVAVSVDMTLDPLGLRNDRKRHVMLWGCKGQSACIEYLWIMRSGRAKGLKCGDKTSVTLPRTFGSAGMIVPMESRLMNPPFFYLLPQEALAARQVTNSAWRQLCRTRIEAR